jgi:hypothetical protein
MILFTFRSVPPSMASILRSQYAWVREAILLVGHGFAADRLADRRLGADVRAWASRKSMSLRPGNCALGFQSFISKAIEDHVSHYKSHIRARGKFYL